MSCIHYKFRSSLEYDTITFDGLAISLSDLKKAIMAQKKFAKITDFDLEVTNAQTKEEYKDEIMQIPKNSSVIVRRIPTGTRSKAQLAAERADPYASGIPKTKSDIQDLKTSVSMKQNKVVDLVSSDASEDDKLKAMMTQAGEDWQPNQYVKGRGRGYNPSGPLPPNYVCYRCGKPGHFIRNCPTNGVKRTIGIPRTFNEDQDGTADDSNKDSKKDSSEPIKKLVPVPELDTSKKERKVPSELQCPMCKNLLTDAVLIPCCGTSYCDECIRTYLLENEQVCPTCGAEDVSPDSLIINKQLRQAVNNFRNARPASPFVNSTTDKPTPNSTADKPVPSSTVDKPSTSSVTEKTAPTTSEPETKPPAAKPEVNSPESSDKDKSEQKVSSTTSEIPQKDVTEVKEEEVKKKEGSPLPVLKTEVSSPRRDAEDHRDHHPPLREPHRTGPRPIGPHAGQHPGFGHHDHPLHRGPTHGPGLGHPMAEAMIPRSIPPEGPLLVPTMRAPRPLLPQPHPGPLMAQPGFIGPAALGLHPVTGHPGIVQPLLGAPIPFGVNPAGFRPFDNRRHVEGLPPMSEEEFYRYQRKMKLRSKRKTHREKEREVDRHPRKERPSNRRQPGNFDDELSQYRALQRHRTRPRSRSRSYSRSHSRSRSHSNSRSVSRSLSHSSRSLSKSPTPEDWDRSRTPSPVPTPTISTSKTPTENEEKKTKQKKRKKHHKQKHSKKSKASETEVGDDKKTENKLKAKEEKEKTEKKKSKSKKKPKDKEKSSKSKKKSKVEEKEATEKSEKTNPEESVTELKEREPTEKELSKEKEHVQEKVDETLVESKEKLGEQKVEKMEENKVEEKEETVEKETVLTEKEENGKDVASNENEKSRKRKSEGNEGENGNKRKKSKEKSSEKKHKKKKHKKKHKRHKKEKEKRSSQSVEGNNDSTEETQEESEEEKEQENAEAAKE